MKKRMKILSLVILSFVLLFMLSNQTGSDPVLVGNTASELQLLADSPLYIDGNIALAAAASSGSGTSGLPYIIENKIINASGLSKSAIFICNTTAYFILRNCTVTNAGGLWKYYAGVHLYNVTNAIIKNNTAKYSYFGIFLNNSNQNRVTNNTANDNYFGICLDTSNQNILTINTANDNTYGGLYLQLSENNTVNNNTAQHNPSGITLSLSNLNKINNNTANHNHDYGIELGESCNNTLIGNTAYNNGASGLVLHYSSNNNTLIGNIATYNSLYGIELYHSSNKNTLTNNIANYHNYNGFWLYEVSQNTLSGNTANHNAVAGIQLEDSNNNTIIANILHENPECIKEVGTCIGNIIEDNDCGETKIPGFTCILTFLGCLLILSLVVVKKQENCFHNIASS